MKSRTAIDIPVEMWCHYKPFSLEKNPGPYQEEARDTATTLSKLLKERFKATKVVLFGSLAGSDFNQWSDIDLAVWGIAPTDYFKAVAFAVGYSSRFKIDLVDADDCSESLLQHIQKYGVVL